MYAVGCSAAGVVARISWAGACFCFVLWHSRIVGSWISVIVPARSASLSAWSICFVTITCSNSIRVATDAPAMLSAVSVVYRIMNTSKNLKIFICPNGSSSPLFAYASYFVSSSLSKMCVAMTMCV